MGVYINPQKMNKEQWLLENATEVRIPSMEDVPVDSMIICLIDNGPFKAAVAYNSREFDEFTRTDDSRPKKFYMAPIEKLKLVSNLGKYLKE